MHQQHLRRSPRARRCAPVALESLESRQLLSVSTVRPVFSAPTIRYFNPNGDDNTPYGTVGPTGLSPTQIRHAYGIDSILFQGGTITGDGAGQTVAIIDAFDNPKFVNSSDSVNYPNSDLFKFNAAFGLSQFGTPGGPTFTKVNQTGGSSYPAVNNGWGGEIALDVEWVHVLAPKANILLVEANDNSNGNLLSGAASWARSQPGVSVVTMSFGAGEFGGETFYDSSVFVTPAGHQGVTFLASTGDGGAPGGYPAYSPNVVAVGGTTLSVSGNNYVSESGWSGSGGGISTIEKQADLSIDRHAERHEAHRARTSRSTPIPTPACRSTIRSTRARPHRGSRSAGTSLSAPCWGRADRDRQPRPRARRRRNA
jgi:subtilase family serine protease